MGYSGFLRNDIVYKDNELTSQLLPFVNDNENSVIPFV